MVDEELRAPLEEFSERDAPLIGVEAILLVDPDPRQLLPSPRELITAPSEFLFRLEQFEPRRQPLFTCPGHVLGHRSYVLPSVEPPLHAGSLPSSPKESMQAVGGKR